MPLAIKKELQKSASTSRENLEKNTTPYVRENLANGNAFLIH